MAVLASVCRPVQIILQKIKGKSPIWKIQLAEHTRAGGQRVATKRRPLLNRAAQCNLFILIQLIGPWEILM